MITARIDDRSRDMFERNRLRVMVEFASGVNERTIIGRDASGGDYLYSPPFGDGTAEPPEGGSLYALDVGRDAAHAIYLALKEHFEPKDAMPVASDRAYADAREDIGRLTGLVDKLVDAVTRDPIIVNAAAVSSSHRMDRSDAGQ